MPSLGSEKAGDNSISNDLQCLRANVGNKRNFICNFRAPDEEHYKKWLQYVKSCKNSGIDICYVILSLADSWLETIECLKKSQQIIMPFQIVNLTQQNTFQYNVNKPRRLPTDLTCSKTQFGSTMISLLIQSYIMDRARDLHRSFSFEDFTEISHNLFRKAILELKKKGRVAPVNPRSNPRFFNLIDREKNSF